jgi:hypothetical protein
LLINYFQDSLTGDALKWYMGLDSANNWTINDLGEAFIHQNKYNLDMTPDRDQLCALAQKDEETSKEYARSWIEVDAQINSTLVSFQYEWMIASAPMILQRWLTWECDSKRGSERDA